MIKLILKVVVVAALPALAFFGGREIMSALSNGEARELKVSHLPEKDRKPLNQRIFGYDVGAVAAYWNGLDDLLEDERTALEVDLVFPLLYGGAFLASLIMAWRALDRPFPFGWLMAPVAITIVSDWMENSCQLAQLQRFEQQGEAALQPALIRLASVATICKLTFFAVCMLFLAVLLVGVVRQEAP